MNLRLVNLVFLSTLKPPKLVFWLKNDGGKSLSGCRTVVPALLLFSRFPFSLQKGTFSTPSSVEFGPHAMVRRMIFLSPFYAFWVAIFYWWYFSGEKGDILLHRRSNRGHRPWSAKWDFVTTFLCILGDCYSAASIFLAKRDIFYPWCLPDRGHWPWSVGGDVYRFSMLFELLLFCRWLVIAKKGQIGGTGHGPSNEISIVSLCISNC